VIDDGGEEINGFEDFEVAFGVVVGLGTVDDGLGFGFPGDFLEGEGCAEQVLGEAFASVGVMGWDGALAAVDMESAVLPGKKVGEAGGTDVFGLAQGVEESVAEEFGGVCVTFGGHAVEAALGVEETVGDEEVEVGVEEEEVAKGVDGGDGTDAAVGEVEAGAEGIAEGLGGGLEENAEQIAAFAEDAAQHAWDGEDELAMGHFMADGVGDPRGDLADAALVARGAEVAALQVKARPPQRRKAPTTAKALGRSGPMAARWSFS
jgi:hypothetical protein